jgi:2-isopropylmalate synthase
LDAAKMAGADVLCLCDTNGGTIPDKLAEVFESIRTRLDGVLGIHCHNDSDVAVANTIAAVQHGATHVQGCINGYGERCGNANLCSILAILELKLGYRTVGREKVKKLTSLARFIADIANLPLRHEQPFVGGSAFAHKGGVHVSAVMKDSATYEHVPPESVGNVQRVLLSDLSGRSNVAYKLGHLGFASELNDVAHRELLQRIKVLEYEGYDFETGDGTFELLVREAAHPEFHPFDVVSYAVSTRLDAEGDRQTGEEERTTTTASVELRVNGEVHSGSASGEGPVHALDLCLRQCLASVYPAISNVSLTDYKVRVLGSKVGTESKVRVLVEWTDHVRSWATVGVSNNVIDASWRALVDALRLELMRLLDPDASQKLPADYSCAV